MTRSAALTVRLPAALKERLEARAIAEHRSLSAQVVAELERSPDFDAEMPPARGRFLDLYAGTAIPDETDFEEVRSQLWGRLPRVEHR